MIRWLRSRIFAEYSLYVLAWFLVFGIAWADSLDLSDDVVSPLAALQQTADLDDLESLKHLEFPVSHTCIEGCSLPEYHLEFARLSLVMSHLQQSSCERPLYQILQVYRI